MSDQNVIKDWKAYFESLGPKPPSTIPDFSPMYAGNPNPHIVFMKEPKTGDLDAVQMTAEEAESRLFEEAKEVYEANDGPEMWVFTHMGGPGWHCPPKPKTRAKK